MPVEQPELDAGPAADELLEEQEEPDDALGCGVVEGDRADVLGVGMLQSLGTRRPTVLQGG